MTRCPTLGPLRATFVVLVALVIAAGCSPMPQAAHRWAANDPARADAVAPPLVHNTSLARTRASADIPAIDWKDANDSVTRIGGWRAYARGAAGAAPPLSPPAPPAAPARPASAPASAR